MPWWRPGRCVRVHTNEDTEEICSAAPVLSHGSELSMNFVSARARDKVKVIEMKAVVFQKNDGEQNLRREIRNMEDGICIE